MKSITEGHSYELDSFEGTKTQTIKFIHKRLNSNGDLETVSDGTTNEELLKVLIDRLSVLNNKFPCRENSIAITKIEEALMWLEKRTKNRIERGVEGKHVA